MQLGIPNADFLAQLAQFFRRINLDHTRIVLGKPRVQMLFGTRNNEMHAPQGVIQIKIYGFKVPHALNLTRL